MVRSPAVRQREHELWNVYRAAKKLEEALELAGLDKQRARMGREEAAALLIDLGVPMPDFGA